ncbi:hypothetical protein IAT38_002231 [Cryptococcus sp. DSM 104549]
MSLPSRPLNSPAAPLLRQVRKHPFLFFGLPFISIIVGASFALQSFTQTKYDYQQTKMRSLNKEEELGMRADRRKIDLKEEYYRLNAPGGQSLSSLDASLDASLDSSRSSSNPTTPPKRPKFSMAAVSQDDYEPVRVPRPEGVPEWGGGRGGEEAPLKGQRKEDRWV